MSGASKRGGLSAALCMAMHMLSRDAAASPQDVFGYGTRATALGATGAASAVGGEATWANPSLLSLGRHRELTLGYAGAYLDLHADGPGMPGRVKAEPMRGTMIAALLPVPFGGVLKDRVALGMAFYTPLNVVVRGRVLYPETPQFATLADRLQTVGVQAGFGLDLGYGVRVGAGFSALAAISGTVVVATDTSGSVGTKVDDQLVASYAPLFGLSVDLGQAYRVGATYRGELDARFSVRIDVYDLGSLEVPAFNIAGLAQYDPAQVQAEIARVKGPWRAAVGVTYKRWSKFPGGPEQTVLCPESKPGCLAPGVADPGFHDTWVPRVGVERSFHAINDWFFMARAGYFYEPSPAPEQKGFENGFDNHRHAITLGYGLQEGEALPGTRIELFSQLHVLLRRNHDKSEAPEDTVGYPRVTTTGRVFLLGFAGTVRF